MQKKKSKRINFAFTLIELLVVIAIIAVFSGFLFVLMSSGVNTAKDGRRMGDVSTTAKAILASNTMANNLAYPIETCNIGVNCTSGFTNYVASNLQANPIDPDAGKYYEYSSLDGINFTVCATLSNGYAYCYESLNSAYANYTPTPGSCGTAINTCSAGILANQSGSSPHWAWNCNGVHTGYSATCNAYTTVSGATLAIPAITGTVSLIVIGGGGGGGGAAYCGGGGGGSGYQNIQTISIATPQTLTINVGTGGASGSGNVSGGSSGGASSISGTGAMFPISAAGGGGGGLGAGSTQGGGGPGGTGFINGTAGVAAWDWHGGDGGAGAQGYGSGVTATAGITGDGAAGGQFPHGIGASGGIGYGAGAGGGGGWGSGGGTGGNGGVGGTGFVIVGY